MDAARDDVTFCAGNAGDDLCPRDTRVTARGKAAKVVHRWGDANGGWREVVEAVATAVGEMGKSVQCTVDEAAAALAVALGDSLVTRVTGFHVSINSPTGLA